MATAAVDVQHTPAPVEFELAITALRDSVSKEDARAFTVTRYKDVWAAAREIERDLERRKSLRNFRRIQPFLAGLEQYSKAIDIFCNGTPILPYVWGPIKLLLEIAQSHLSALEKLIEAYGMIGEAMPRFDRLSSAFRKDPAFQRVMGYFFADILEFHRRAYKFFRQRAWKSFFESFWKTFNSKLQAILESLRKHRDLIDRGAEMINITEAKAWRTAQTEQLERWRLERTKQVEKEDKIRLEADIRETVAWLSPPDDQEDLLIKLSRTCNLKENHWILKNQQVLSWLKDSREYPIVWLNGKPGAGKSVVCSIIIDHINDIKTSVAIYYFCRSYTRSLYTNEIHRSLSSQLLVKNPTLAPYILETFANHGQKPSKKSLDVILERLLVSLPYVRIIIDGIDECPLPDQDELFDDLKRLEEMMPKSCKMISSSRKTPLIIKHFHTKPTVRLEDHAEDVKGGIASLVESRLGKLKFDFEPEVIESLERKLVEKANGMFLWVRLVMSTLEDSYSEQDFHNAVEALPEEIECLYERIFSRICGNAKSPIQKRAIRILQWMIVAQRPLRRSELEYGIFLDEYTPLVTNASRLRGDVLSLCTPVLDIEDGPEGLVSFTHFTAYEYLQAVSTPVMLQRPRAHLTVSLSCTLYLVRGLSFLNPNFMISEQHSEVLQLFHELHQYASRYWVRHILALSNHIGQSILQEHDLSPLRQSLENLATAYRTLSSVIGYNPRTPGIVCPSELKTLADLLNLSALCREFLVGEVANHQRRSVSNTHRGTEAGDHYDDETHSLFDIARLAYQAIVEELLSRQDANDRLLSDFKARYSFGLYTCRYQGCPRTVQGFMSAQLRETHEDLHSPKFRCMEPQCKIPGGPFKTQAALTRHNKKHHLVKSLSSIPSSLRALTRDFGSGSFQEQAQIRSQATDQTQAESVNQGIVKSDFENIKGDAITDLNSEKLFKDSYFYRRGSQEHSFNKYVNIRRQRAPSLAQINYDSQLMALEQQNKKRLMMARQEQENQKFRPDGIPRQRESPEPISVNFSNQHQSASTNPQLPPHAVQQSLQKPQHLARLDQYPHPNALTFGTGRTFAAAAKESIDIGRTDQDRAMRAAFNNTDHRLGDRLNSIPESRQQELLPPRNPLSDSYLAKYQIFPKFPPSQSPFRKFQTSPAQERAHSSPRITSTQSSSTSVTPQPAPAPKKRSNIMSILNDDNRDSASFS